MDIKLMPKEYSGVAQGGGGFSGLDSSGGNSSARAFFLIISIIILAIVILTCAGLWVYHFSLIKERDQLEASIVELENQRDQDAEANLISLKKEIENLKKILDNRLYASNILKILEELTLPQSQLIGFSGNLSQASLSTAVETTDYKNLAKQLVVFKSDQRIKEINVSGISLSREGGVNAALSFKLNPEFLLRR